MVMSMPGYRVTEQLHEGPGSNVYRGIREKDGQAVVLKRLNPAYPSPEKIAWFKREYELLRSVEVAGVAKPHELGVSEYHWVMVLEDAGGESLNHVARRRALPLAEVLELAIGLVEVLGQVHRRGIIHKNINPAHIVWNPERNRLQLIDFGIATTLPQQSAPIRNPDVLEGELDYISPEQTGRMNRAIDYRSDFYSLGVTLYELLTGRRPFQATDPLELVHCHIARQPPPPHELDPAIPRAVSELVMKLMAKTADARYQSAYGIKADLRECLNQLREHGTVVDFPLGQRDTFERFRLPQKLYGREAELERLLTAFDRVAAPSGRAEMMLVTGYSGIGKSMLVRELYKPLTERRGYFISGKFDQLQRSTPYTAVASAFQSLVRQLLGESEAQVVEWRERLLAALGPNGRVLIDIIPEMELLIGAQPPVPQLGPTEAQNRFNLVFQSAIRVFAQPRHPLVIFLDDLQWADSASLKLIELVMGDDELRHLFLIGTYRDNEVGPAHPLTMLLDSLLKRGSLLKEVHLGPLDLPQTSQLIADTVGQTPEAVGPLAELVHRKTDGNPFFINELLKTVHQEGLITFDGQEGRWRWDIARLKARGITENIVEFMIGNLKRLAVPTQQVLRLAACIGSSFDLHTLSLIQEMSLERTAELLAPALQAGFVLTASEPEVRAAGEGGEATLFVQHYKFLHDRVQQAAYALIGEDERRTVHLRIGRLVLANATQQELTEQVFTLVGHLNIGRSLLTTQDERLMLSRLNVDAARKAKAAMAYAAAREYLTVAKEPLDEKSWEEHYALTLHVYRELGEVEYLNSNYDASEPLIRRALERARTPIEKADIHAMLVTQHTMRARYPEAIEEARNGLARLGVDLPQGDVTAAMQAEFAEVQKTLAERDYTALLHEPPMSDSGARSTIKLLMRASSAAFYVDRMLYGLVVFKSMNLALRYGPPADSSALFAYYGHLLSAITGQHHSGYEFGLLGLKLCERFNNPADKCKGIFILSNFVLPWVKHLRTALPFHDTGYQAGLESGELPFAGYLLVYKVINQLFEGKLLSQVRADLPQFLLFNQKGQNQLAVDTLLGLKLIVSNLSGTTDGRLDFRADGLTEKDFLARCQTANSLMAICFYHVLKTSVLCHYGEAAAALEASAKAEELISTILGSAGVAQHNFYTSLSLAALYPSQSAEEQRKSWARLEANQQQLKQWAESCAENHAHMYTLVAAELARVSEKPSEAVELYERAITLARQNGFLHQEALANELAARSALERGQERSARDFMAAAHYGYRLLGARYKDEELAARHPTLLGRTGGAPEPGGVRAGGAGTSGALDLISVVKACQAISSEIVLDKLLAKLMDIVVENAGAQRGVLILAKGNELTVHVDTHPEAGMAAEARVLPVAAERYPSVAQGIVNYVARTGESVILNDALQEGSFTRDPYVLRTRPRSILGTPLTIHGELLGLLYLENNLTTCAFTPERLEFLRLLLHQVAISIQNALLYEEMEKKVEKRTEELRTRNADLQSALQHLRETQAQLTRTEKMASLGRLAAGIAHEIKNPLNFINNFAELNIELVREFVDEIKAAPSLSVDAVEDLLGNIRSNGERILQHGKRADDIVRSMMQHASGASGERKPTDLNALVDEYVKLAQHGMKAQGAEDEVRIERAYDGQVGHISLVPQEIGRVLVNLLNNAFYAVREKQQTLPHGQYTPKVAIYTHKRGPNVEIRVQDNGSGIAAELQSRIFEPFFTTKPPGVGTGLGLSLSHEIVVQGHHGALGVQSEKGQGATFIITLPGAVEA